MKSTFNAVFAASPTVTKDDYLIAPYIFINLNCKPVFIENIQFCGISINDIPDAYCAVYSGEQIKADPILVAEMAGWTDKHIFRDLPYLAIKIKYSDLFKNVTRIVVTADITF